MMNIPGLSSSRNVFNVALAYFANPRNLHDASTDLCLAGFNVNSINVSSLMGGARPLSAGTEKSRALADQVEQHTWRWRMRRFMVHDRQRRGADQISGEDCDPLAFINPECPRIDLCAVLAGMNVPEATVELLRGDTQSERTFMLVDAQDRVFEASNILQANRGQLRTDYLYST